MKDENTSRDMGSIMGRLKELRDAGFTVILLHHTPKNSDKMSKGSTAIVDLADHILGLTKVKKKKDGRDTIIDDEDDDEDAVYRFGVREKTRFEPHHLYLTLNPDRGFELARNPQEDTLKEMHGILVEHGSPVTKTDFVKACTDLGIGEKKLRRLVDIGRGRYWDISIPGPRNVQYVTPKGMPASLSLVYSSAKLPNCSDTHESGAGSPVIIDKVEVDKTLGNREPRSPGETAELPGC